MDDQVVLMCYWEGHTLRELRILKPEREAELMKTRQEFLMQDASIFFFAKIEAVEV